MQGAKTSTDKLGSDFRLDDLAFNYMTVRQNDRQYATYNEAGTKWIAGLWACSNTGSTALTPTSVENIS